MIRMTTERKGGFTVIEMLIIVAVIAILASMAIPALVRAEKARKEGEALRVLNSLRDAERAYRARTGSYADLDTLKAEGSSPVGNGEVEPSSGYTFSMKGAPDADGYTIVATPPRPNMTTYTLTQTGEVSSSEDEAPH